MQISKISNYSGSIGKTNKINNDKNLRTCDKISFGRNPIVVFADDAIKDNLVEALINNPLNDPKKATIFRNGVQAVFERIAQREKEMRIYQAKHPWPQVSRDTIITD